MPKGVPDIFVTENELPCKDRLPWGIYRHGSDESPLKVLGVKLRIIGCVPMLMIPPEAGPLRIAAPVPAPVPIPLAMSDCPLARVNVPEKRDTSNSAPEAMLMSGELLMEPRPSKASTPAFT